MLGPLLTAAGYALLGTSGDTASYWRGFLPGLVVVGIGVTLTVAPLTTTVLDAAPDAKGGTASGINSAADVAGGLLAIAALGLAVGAAGAGGMQGEALAGAYRTVMFAAAGLAVLAVLAAALTIGGPGNRPLAAGGIAAK